MFISMQQGLSSGVRRALLIAVVVMLGAAAKGADTSATPVAANSATIEQLTRQARNWDEVIVRKDKAAIAANMADDFRHIDGDGVVTDKAAFVADLVSSKLEIDPYTVEDFDIRLYGEVALLSGWTHMTGRFDGKPFELKYRYIDIYVKRQGAWKIVSVQITRLPK